MDIMEHEKEENLMKFGDNLRNLRKSKKLSQEDLAEKMVVFSHILLPFFNLILNKSSNLLVMKDC